MSKHDRTCLVSVHDVPEGVVPCTCGASQRSEPETHENPAQPSEED